MSKVWGEMRISLAQYVAEIRPGRLDREQQGRLALGWPSLWWVEDLESLGEDDWRKALCYSVSEWELVREAYADALDRGTCWGLHFMLDERRRQNLISEQQAERGRRSASTRVNQRSAVVEQSLNGGSTVVDQRSTVVNLASASALESESESLSAPSAPRRRRGVKPDPLRPETLPEGFKQFWEAYRCVRRTGKQAALVVWTRLDAEKSSDAILSELRRFQGTSQWRDGFMPEPSRWLAKTPWVDGPVQESRGGDQW